jgi:tripartite-type tricarboxylate transporter receptor subunit TctC
MKLARRSWLQAGLTLPLLGRSAFAQSFPENRPIRWVVPFPPGGQTDSTARLTAQGLATVLPANIVVENRAGGQGTVGSDHVRQSPPDGHTLLFSASTFALGRRSAVASLTSNGT